MEKAAKLITIILAALFVGSAFLLYQANNEKQDLIKKYSTMEESLRSKNESLARQLDSAQEEKRRIEERINLVKRDLDNVTAERDEWKRKYDLVSKEKEELIERLKATPRVAEPTVAVTPAPEEDARWASVLKEKAGLEVQLNNLKDQLDNLFLQLEEAKKGKIELENQLTKLSQEREGVDRQLRYNKDLADTLSRDLAREKTDKNLIKEQLEKIKQDNLALRNQLKRLTDTKLSLEKRIKELDEEKETLGGRLSKVEVRLQERLSDILQIKRELETAGGGKPGEVGVKSIELPPIIVRAPVSTPGGIIEEGKTGKILSVNEDNNFVIIDLGENAAVKVGDNFAVYRGTKQIATIQVIQTRSDISAAEIKQQRTKIRAGDLVK